MTDQLTRDQAIAFHDSGAWKDMPMRERAVFQLNQDKLCMPFGAFHEAVEKATKRPVFTHEFADTARLLAEIAGVAPAPTFEQIIGMIPAEKRVAVFATRNQTNTKD